MPAERRYRRAVVLRVPLNIDLKARPSRSVRQEVPEPDATSASQPPTAPTAEASAPPLSGVPLDGGTTTTSNIVGTSSARSTEPIDRNQQRAMVYRNSATSAAEWNSLLTWARKQRGPQWDAGTGMFQVEKGSAEYYSFSSDPSQSVRGQEEGVPRSPGSPIPGAAPTVPSNSTAIPLPNPIGNVSPSLSSATAASVATTGTRRGRPPRNAYANGS